MRQKRSDKDLDVKYILKTYWSFLKKYKSFLAGITLCGFLLTSLSVMQRTFFKKIVDNGELFAKSQINYQAFIGIIIAIASAWAIVILSRSVIRWLRIHFLNKIESKTMFDLKRHYYNHIINLSHKFHTTHKTGSMIARISRGSSAMERMTDFLSFQTLSIIFEFTISSIVLFFIDKRISLVIIVVGIIFVIYSSRLQKIQRKLNVITNNAEDIEKATIGDTFTNIDSIKYYGKEDMIQNRYASKAENTSKAMLKQWNIGR